MSDYTAEAVIGAAFGDEGKGITVDKVCQSNDAEDCIVVRHSGGAQAGHTVVRTEEVYLEEKDDHEERTIRHVFHHFGSGTIQGFPTMLGQRFVSNPILWRRERRDLARIYGKELITDIEEFPVLYADPRGLVSTHVDMLINEMIESKRQKTGDHHGSVGAGIHETMVRSSEGPRMTVDGLKAGEHGSSAFRADLREWARLRMDRLGLAEEDDPQRYEWLTSDAIEAAWLTDCDAYAKGVETMFPQGCEKHVIFEGAQGLLLDMDNTRFFPHLTHANTGMTNALEWLAESENHHLTDVYYVTRPYLTRHGAGPFPSEDPLLSYHDDTNRPATFQGSLRFGHWDGALVGPAVNKDMNRVRDGVVYQDDEEWEELTFKYSLTHVDQVGSEVAARVIRDLSAIGLEPGYLGTSPNTSDMVSA